MKAHPPKSRQSEYHTGEDGPPRFECVDDLVLWSTKFRSGNNLVSIPDDDDTDVMWNKRKVARHKLRGRA